MILPYFQNNLGASLSEEDYQDIKHPYVEMYTHVTLKTVQIGVVAGTLLFGPLLSLRKNSPGFVSTVTHSGKVGTAIGLVAGPLMTCQRFRDQSEAAVLDRAYRVRKNRSQVRCDRAFVGGCGLGAISSLAASVNPVFGGLIGASVGIVGMGIYNNVPGSNVQV